MGETNTDRREIPIQFDDQETDSESIDTRQSKPEGEPESESSESQASAVDPDPAANADRRVEVAEPLAELQSQIDSLSQERSSLLDQLLRRQAEFENYRKRIERERSETYQRARAEVLLELLPVVDNLERALSSLETSQGDAEALHHGVELIHKQFRDALSKFGLEPVESLGRTFDPHVHEAVTIEPTDEHEENTILEEFQRGYRMGEKLLRPAKVKVASTPEK